MDTFEKTFLESNREFKFNSKLDKFNRAESKKLFNKLLQNQFTYKISQREENFETFIANILYDSGTPISMCYDKNWYPGKSMAYTSAIAIKNTLKKEGYINIKDGYNFPDGRRHARIWATEKLVNEFKNVKPYCGGDFNLVELKSKKQRYDNGRLKRKKGKLLLLNKSRTIPFKENEFTIQLRRKLEKINRINKKFKMTLDGVKLDVAVKAVFTESFNYHGRVYANGSNRFQQYSGEDRSCILIDGEPVIERDYSGLHPRMLYAQEGIQFNEDPYMIVSGNPAVRPFLKTMLLTMVNSETFNEAQLACNAWLNPEYVQDGKGVIAIYKYQNDLMSETGKEDFEEKCKQAKAVKKTGIDTAKPLMEKFLKEHERIRKYLCSGNKTGMKLMNKDSKIALYVCKYFINKKIPVLPVHDSFIVPAEYEQELMTIMDKAYRKYTKDKDNQKEFYCPIK